MPKKITYEEYEKKDGIFAEKLNICEMLDAEMDHIKFEFKNGNISEKNYNNKSEIIYKQVIKILS